MSPRGNSYSHIYQHAPAEILAVRYGEAMADGLILVPTSFLQVRESSRCFLGFVLYVSTWSYVGIKRILVGPYGFRY
jgi:hypothetical protein